MEQVAFGPFTLDTARGTLLRGGAAVPLGQRALAVLAALAETPGRTVAKEDLLARAWPGTIVEEGNLTVQVAALRRALGGDGQDSILTVPRVGYRLALPAPAAPDTTPVIPDSGRPALRQPRRRPGAGLVRGRGRRGHHRRPRPVPQLCRRPTQLGLRLQGADRRYPRGRPRARGALPAGGHRAAGGRAARITARLLDGRTGAQLWADSFDGALAEVFDFQDRITDAVATVVEPRIQAAEIERSRRERPGSVETYDIYLRALASILSETEAGNAEAYALVVEGLGHEPQNPLLLTLAAWALEHRSAMGWRPFGPDDRQRCGAYARAASERAGGDASILSRCGVSLLQGAREYDWGMAMLSAAVEANPNDVAVLVQAAVGNLHCGDLDEALALVARADRLQAGDLGAHFTPCLRAHVALIRGQHALALDFASRAFALNASFDPSLWMLVAAHAHLGQLQEARHYLAMLQGLAPGITVASIRAGQPAKDPSRIAAILDGLRLAGLPEQ